MTNLIEKYFDDELWKPMNHFKPGLIQSLKMTSNFTSDTNTKWRKVCEELHQERKGLRFKDWEGMISESYIWIQNTIDPSVIGCKIETSSKIKYGSDCGSDFEGSDLKTGNPHCIGVGWTFKSYPYNKKLSQAEKPNLYNLGNYARNYGIDHMTVVSNYMKPAPHSENVMAPKYDWVMQKKLKKAHTPLLVREWNNMIDIKETV